MIFTAKLSAEQKMHLWKIRYFLENLLDKSFFLLGVVSNGLVQKICLKGKIPLRSREHLLLLVNSLGLTGDSVEVGVFEGYFSEQILKHTKLSKLFSVDPWEEFSKGDYLDRANAGQLVQDERYKSVCKRLGKFGKRSEIIREKSLEAAGKFADESLDFVYIDANHSYQGCFEDISTWWPKLKSGGLIAGDDYINASINGTDYGVEKAVKEFFEKQGSPFYVTYKSMKVHWPNWYAIKK
jgi:hypothetical protein